MLPYEPEPFDQLQDRFHLALTPIYSVQTLLKEMKLNPKSRPGMQRKHVFDFEDGLRVIASVEADDRVPALQREPYLHVSFSSHSRMHDATVPMLHERTMQLSRGRLPEPSIEVTPKKVVHFFYDGVDFVKKLNPAELEAVRSTWLGVARFR